MLVATVVLTLSALSRVVSFEIEAWCQDVIIFLGEIGGLDSFLKFTSGSFRLFVSDMCVRLSPLSMNIGCNVTNNNLSKTLFYGQFGKIKCLCVSQQIRCQVLDQMFDSQSIF